MATVQQLESALRKADAAGNVEDARALAAEIRRLRTAQPAKADFSGVTATASSTEAAPDYGPLGVPGVSTEEFRRNMQQLRGPGTDAEIANQVNQNVMAGRQAAFQDAPAPIRALAGIGQRVASNARGIRQLGAMALDAVLPEERGIGSLVSGQPTSRYDRAMADEARARENERFMEGDTAATVGKVAGDIGLLAIPGSAASRGATFASRLAGNAALGAGYAGFQPVVEGESRGLNSVMGGLLGAGGELVGRGLAAAGNRAASAIAPEVRAMLDAASERGIKLTPAQISDSRALKFAQSMMRSVPFTGAKGRYDKQIDQFTRAVSRTIGEDAERITPEVFAGAKARIGDRFNELSANSQLPVDEGMLGKLVAVQQEAAQLGEEGTSKAVNGILSRLMEQTKDGVLPGRVYQSMDSQLGKLMKTGGEKSYYLGEIRDVLRESMDDAITGEARAAWQQARGQWRNLKTIEDLVGKSETGAISPASLMGRVTANRAGKASMAAGTSGEIGTLARIGQRIKEPPSSGTAERQMLTGGIWGAGGMVDPVTTGALFGAAQVGSRLLDSNVLARLIAREGRGSGLKALAKVTPAGGVAASPIVNKKRRRDN
ncbi:hypothetical protein [Pseudoxanthomonas beigongshangi]